MSVQPSSFLSRSRALCLLLVGLFLTSSSLQVAQAETVRPEDRYLQAIRAVHTIADRVQANSKLERSLNDFLIRLKEIKTKETRINHSSSSSSSDYFGSDRAFDFLGVTWRSGGFRHRSESYQSSSRQSYFRLDQEFVWVNRTPMAEIRMHREIQESLKALKLALIEEIERSGGDLIELRTHALNAVLAKLQIIRDRAPERFLRDEFLDQALKRVRELEFTGDLEFAICIERDHARKLSVRVEESSEWDRSETVFRSGAQASLLSPDEFHSWSVARSSSSYSESASWERDSTRIQSYAYRDKRCDDVSLGVEFDPTLVGKNALDLRLLDQNLLLWIRLLDSAKGYSSLKDRAYPGFGNPYLGG